MKAKKIKIPQNSLVYFQLVFPKIIETIRLAAAPSEDQIAVFTESEYPPDEVAFLMEHAVLMATVLNSNGFLSSEKLTSVMRVDEEFDKFSKEDWTLEAMRNAERWKSIRRLAFMALKTLNVSYAAPNIYWKIDIA